MSQNKVQRAIEVAPTFAPTIGIAFALVNWVRAGMKTMNRLLRA